MIWKKVTDDEPNFDKVRYLVIEKINNDYVFAFAYWNGEEWEPNKIEGYNIEVIAFCETKPKTIIENL